MRFSYAGAFKLLMFREIKKAERLLQHHNRSERRALCYRNIWPNYLSFSAKCFFTRLNQEDANLTRQTCAFPGTRQEQQAGRPQREIRSTYTTAKSRTTTQTDYCKLTEPRCVWLCVGIKPTLRCHHFLSFQSSEIKNPFGRKRKFQTEAVVIVPGLTHGSYKQKPTAASPCCTHAHTHTHTHTEDTFISKVGTMKRTAGETHTHT